MIAIIDYGVGNLFSLGSSLKAIGEEAVITSDAEVIKRADHVILPGVGAFGDAVDKLRESGLYPIVKEVAASGVPMLGICVGMQLLFDEGLEFGRHEGLGLIHGTVDAIAPRISSDYDIPHMGWNALNIDESKNCPLLATTKQGTYVYFVHSYAAFDCKADTVATVEYGTDLTAVVWKDNVYGTQFHPEKSGEAGLAILKQFASL